jgi:toxin ParE1/3/4
MYRLTLDVVDDLQLIVNYIGTRNPQGAVTVIEALTRKFEMLGDFPHAGDRRPEFGEGVRIVSVGNYVVYFRPEGHGALILRVFHGARDIHSLDEE